MERLDGLSPARWFDARSGDCRMKALCWFFHGGHAWSLPKVIDGKLRLECQYGCGARSSGIETRGQELQRERRQVKSFGAWIRYQDERRRVA